MQLGYSVITEDLLTQPYAAGVGHGISILMRKTN